ncbi:MAG: hypothetical protein NT164_01255 [Verrucomicrobiae bacterium]|nr:hypothetical protein [Verrucomicrobiae bacterium]
MMPLSFLIPEQFITDASYYNAWHHEKEIPLKGREMGTQECWIYQTWALLKHAGLHFSLVTEPPEEGILIMHADQSTKFLKDDAPFSEKLFVVNIVADTRPHPRAHLNIVQNKAYHYFMPRSLFMPHWSQSHLIMRDPARGSRFENIVFFGYHDNIAAELLTEEWSDTLRRTLGLYFYLQEAANWHDYSQVDCSIAIRDFSHQKHFRRPATKLYNAWQAGVPFIGGSDSAFSSEGHPGKNYFKATSPNQVLNILKRLKESDSLRMDVANEGWKSKQIATRDAIFNRWKDLVLEVLPRLAAAWFKKSSSQQSQTKFLRTLACSLDRYLVN